MKIKALLVIFSLSTLTLSAQLDQSRQPLDQATQIHDTTIAANKAVVGKWIAARNTNDLESALSFWADEWQERLTHGFNGTTVSFPDVKIIADDMIAENDKVVLRWTLKGTHNGPYRDIPATGKAITWTGVDIYTLKEGKIVGIMRATDPEAISRQLQDE
ncbi:MAG: ester cyclase [Saprospiraceae bacterium]|nr:ester cyclase [Saprospiraceae bacterium]